MQLEWDERKRLANLAKHGFDFRDVHRVFEGPILELPSSYAGEARIVAIGAVAGLELAVVFYLARIPPKDRVGQKGASS